MTVLLYTATFLIACGLLFGWMRERFEASAHPSPGKLPPTRNANEPPPKAVYDVLAEHQLQRLEERRRRIAPDTGERRRKTDKLGG